jgi:hypothetical protein
MAKQDVAKRGPFATQEQATTSGKPDDKSKLFTVTVPGEAATFVWARDHGHALVLLARAKGWSSGMAGKPVNKDQLVAGLAALSPEDRAVLIAAYVPAPAPAPAGKGKKQ